MNRHRMNWHPINRRTGNDGVLIDGLLFAGELWQSPAVSVHVSTRNDVALTLSVGGFDDDAGLHVGLGFANVHLGLREAFPRAWRERAGKWAEHRAARLNFERLRSPDESGPVYAHTLDPFSAAFGRLTGIRYSEGVVLFDLWANGDWSRGDTGKAPWNGNGWTARIDLRDVVFGRARHEAEAVAETAVDVVMPEGRYPATVKIGRRRIVRPWRAEPWYWSAEVDCPLGVPIPGKGENAHDCGDDAIYGLSLGFDRRPNPTEATRALTGSALGDRVRHGGAGWAPEAGWPVGVVT